MIWFLPNTEEVAEGKATQAKLTFGHRDKDNEDQFTISVVQNQGDGTGLYGHEDDNTYEVAMWFQGRDSMLPLSVYDDVLGWSNSRRCNSSSNA